MFSTRVDKKNNLLTLNFRGGFDAVQAELLLQRLQEELPKLKTGFSVLSILSELDGMSMDCREHIEKCMDLCNEHGVVTVVRVIPNQHKDIGLGIMSMFHYSKKVKIYSCKSVEEAKHYLILRSDSGMFNKLLILLKIARARGLEVLSSPAVRVVVLSVFFIGLMFLRRVVHVFGASLGYLYVTAISLSGFWFGFKGGLFAAAIASAIFLLEVNIFKYWEARDIVVMGMYLRFFVYFLSGVILGYFSDLEKRLKVKLEFLAGHDELTGCFNLRFLLRILEKEVMRSKRYEKELTISLVDIDNFKGLNDRYGPLWVMMF